MFSQKIDFELIRPFFQNISREKQAQNLFFLAHIVNEINYKSIESIYEKNVCLLKKNNKLLHKCPSMGEIISFFKNININKRYLIIIFNFQTFYSFFKISNGNKTNTPSQYFFPKVKLYLIGFCLYTNI